ncbi:ArfGap-domain-containing protein [Russula dissimulans]|nr:ArfGap-domain-containing protein [Russula dissimulans]
MDQTLARRTLQDLIKRENKLCIDCGNPNPQWASLSFAVFICLQCAGIHRGFGVHISFVRSVSMDTWQEDQVRRMKIGGNAPFVAFMQSYTPVEQGGYREGMSTHEKYHSWAAVQYREKLDADLQNRPWSPSAPPEDFKSPGSGVGPSSRPSSAQGLRKSRASARSGAGTALRADSASPSLSSSTPVSPNSNIGKPANETYFAALGSLNSSRPDDLPPSQGGRYQGFGNTPDPPAGSQHPSYDLTSRAAPTLSELQENPMAALSKGWSLFSSAMVGASRAVSENVIQPGVERVTDPTFQASVRGYVDEAGRRAGQVGSSVNQWGKSQLGVDVAGQLGGVVGTVRGQIGGGPTSSGYSRVFSGGSQEEETSALYRDHDDDEDLFREYHGTGNRHSDATSARVGTSNTPAEAAKPSGGWDEEWKDSEF